MRSAGFLDRITGELNALRDAGTYKEMRYLQSATAPVVHVDGRGEVILLCSNDYLGFANHPEVVSAGVAGLHRYGAGTASVRFISGSFEVHRELEEALAGFLGKEAALTYVSCWNANAGVIGALLGEGDVIFSDELNHASIIDACRLAKGAAKVIYAHNDMDDLRSKLREHRGARTRMIVTDGVFSMEGDLAPLPDLCELAAEHDALVMVDDSHGTGVLGRTGRGTAEHFGLMDEVDIVTGTLGKALGGAAGGFVAAGSAVIDFLAQRSRPQLFSNALPPTVAASACAALSILQREPERVRRLHENTQYFRGALVDLGYEPLPGQSAIIPIIVGETAKAIALSQMMYDEGVYLTGFGYPVVPEGTARLRVQISSAHTRDVLDRALQAFDRLRKHM